MLWRMPPASRRTRIPVKSIPPSVQRPFPQRFLATTATWSLAVHSQHQDIFKPSSPTSAAQPDFPRSQHCVILPSRRNKMATLSTHPRKHKVTVIGSGNWGTAISKIVAENTREHGDLFEELVDMWVFEEKVVIPKNSNHYDPSSPFSQTPHNLTEVVNRFHENVKYLPGIQLPTNLRANPSLDDAARHASILIFNVPHQFIIRICDQLQGKVLPYARGISCIKGVDVNEEGVSLFSETIGKKLGIYCGALSGANIATEVAKELYSETTVGYDPPTMDSKAPTPTNQSPSSSTVDVIHFEHKDTSGQYSEVRLRPLPAEYPPIDHGLLKTLFHRPYFHVRAVSDVAGVALGGALKNIVAIAAGFFDGMGWGDNAKAAIMRVGLLEMVKFGTQFFGASVIARTFTEESAGVADLITSCNGGRNHRCAKLSIQRKIPIDEVEKQELNGQKLQGTLTSYEVNKFLKKQGVEHEYPLFTCVQHVLEGKMKVEDIPNQIDGQVNGTNGQIHG